MTTASGGANGDHDSPLASALLATFDEVLAIDELDLTWLGVATSLLRFCRENQPSSEDWKDLLGGEPLTTVRASQTFMLEALLRVDPAGPALLEEGEEQSSPSLVTEFATVEAVEELRRAAVAELGGAEEMWTANGGSSKMLAVAVALSAARAIDQLYGATFVHVFRREPELSLNSGEAYPVTHRSPRLWLGEHPANSDPATQATRDMAWTPRLRLAREGASDFDFVVDFTLWDYAGAIGHNRELVLAAGQPALTLAEFDYRNEGGVYFNRGPGDPEKQAGHVTDLLVAAGRESVHVLVLPEYTLNEAAVSALRSRMEHVESAPRLMVSGFVEERGGNLVNRAWLCVHGGSARWPTHERLLPAKMTGAPIGDAAEGIQTGSEVRIFVTRQWTIAVLICRDAMDRDVARQLTDLGVNLLLVPSMSAKSATMIDTLTEVKAHAQAFVVLANGPVRWTLDPDDQTRGRGVEAADGEASKVRVEAAFMGPYAHPASTVLMPGCEGAPDPLPDLPGDHARGLWSFRSSSRQVGWHM